jgi:cytochrome c553
LIGSKTVFTFLGVILLVAAGAPQPLAAQARATAAAPAAPPPPLSPITLQGDVDHGAVLAYTCMGCHGIPGYHNAYPSYSVPKLGGQNADYLEIALQGYRRGTRSHPTMQAQASSLTDQDIADIAAFFESQAGEPTPSLTSATPQLVEEGKRKATACVQCHGEAGVAAAAQWPNLAGQHESYLLQALAQYKNGQRSDLLMGPMVKPLDDETIAQLAAFFSAQSHLYGIHD